MASKNPFGAGDSYASGTSRAGPTEVIAPYASVHGEGKTKGPGDPRPTALQIIKDEGLEGKWADKVVLVTGATSGIGIPTAAAMAATGARVFMTARSPEKGKKVVAEINADLPAGTKPVELIAMDNESLDSVRKGAQEFLSKSDKLNVLIGNAGIMACPFSRTTDGFESQFQVCHLAHFLLFQLLKPALLRGATPEFASRVVLVSSMGHRSGGVDFDNINYDKPDSYNEWKAYGQAKTATIYTANYIERNFGPEGIHAVSLHPGGIDTGLQRHVQDLIAHFKEDPATIAGMKSAEQGAATTVWGATAKALEGKGRLWLEDCQTCGPLPDNPTNFSIGYTTWAFDDANEDRLWKVSNEMVGFKEV